MILKSPTFEDALITLTHARNAAEGLGLTHHLGEPPVQGFTSALSVLIPLVGELLASGFGLTLLRLVSVVAAVGSIYFAYRIARRLGLGGLPLVLVLGYLAVERNQVFYGIAGMETQLAVALLLGSILAVLESRPMLVGVSLGLAVLVRPDFALWALIAVATAALRGRRELLLAVIPAVLIAGPWAVFTTLYYGSPIPNTVIAKATAYVPPINFEHLETWLWIQVIDHAEGIARTFAPFFADSDVVGALIPRPAAIAISLVIWALAIVGSRATWRYPAWRPAIIFAGAFLVYRTLLLPTTYFDWYLPPFTAVAVLLAGAGLQAVRGAEGLRPLFTGLAAVVIVVVFALHAPLELMFRTRLTSEPVLQQVGEYLREHVPPGESVTTEPAGYIGYFSRTKLYDYPGLTSKVSLATFRTLSLDDRSLAAFIDRLQPDWLALRGWEWDDLKQRFPGTAALYSLRSTFGDPRVAWSPGETIPTVGIPGFEIYAFSARFYVLERTD